MKGILDDLNPGDREEVLATAVDITNGPMWKLVFERIEEFHVETLKSEPTYSLTAVKAHASLQVLDQVRREISLIVSANRMRNK